MRDRNYRIEGIVIKRINFSEADKILTLFSKQKGKVVCLAKGVRKICSKRGPCLELFNQVKACLVKGKGIDILTEVEVIEEFPRLQKKLSTISNAFYLVELIDRLTAESQENFPVYKLLVDSLQKINIKGDLIDGDFIDFQKKLLNNLGFGLPPQINKQTLEYHIESIIDHKINSKSFNLT